MEENLKKNSSQNDRFSKPRIEVWLLVLLGVARYAVEQTGQAAQANPWLVVAILLFATAWLMILILALLHLEH